jgi:hypothetical protein
VTNGPQHLLPLRRLTEQAVRRVTPVLQMPQATHAFSAENAAAQLGAAFGLVTRVRRDSRALVVIRDAGLARDSAPIRGESTA